MPQKLKELFVKYKTIIFQFLKYNFTGLLNTLLDIGLFTLIAKGFNYNVYIVTKTISYSAGIINSYFFNKFWTFKKNKQEFKGMEVVKFLIINGITLVVSILAIGFLKNQFGIDPFIGNFIVFPVPFVINFILYKLWIFKS